MTKTSAGKETIEMAIQTERNGAHFYEQMAHFAKSEEVRYTFQWLAESEEGHRKAFLRMLSNLGGFLPAEPVDVHQQEIEELSRSEIFSKEKVETFFKRTVHTDLEAIEIGIKFEIDSILLYEAIRDLAENVDRDILDMIISEKQKHISELKYHAGKLRAS